MRLRPSLDWGLEMLKREPSALLRCMMAGVLSERAVGWPNVFVSASRVSSTGVERSAHLARPNVMHDWAPQRAPAPSTSIQGSHDTRSRLPRHITRGHQGGGPVIRDYARLVQ